MTSTEKSRPADRLDSTFLRRFCHFALVGLIGVVVQLGSLFCLTTFGFHYLPASLLAVEIAVLNNFIWHRRWTWRDRNGYSIVASFALFHLANGMVSLAGHVLLLPLLVSGLNIDLVPSNLLAIAVCSLANFGLADRLVFRRNPLPWWRRASKAAQIYARYGTIIF